VLILTYRYRSTDHRYRLAERAVALANRAIQLEPERAAGYSARAYMASRSHAPSEAVVGDCERASELEPGAADGLSWCARVLQQRGEREAAFEAPKQSIAIDPKNA
jgi:tetratricopeptide (TPR) repeat protein